MGSLNVLILDGHPDDGRRLIPTLLDAYAAALPADAAVQRFAVRDLSFDPNLRRGFAQDMPWEPDLVRVADALAACDHLVLGFPLWWGGEPAMVKGLFDRILMPGFAFSYRRGDPFWQKLLAGRSADVIVTADTPPWFLRLVYGDPIGRRMRKQVLGFSGLRPVRVTVFGPTRQGAAAKGIEAWKARAEAIARSAAGLRRGPRHAAGPRSAFAQAVADRE